MKNIAISLLLGVLLTSCFSNDYGAFEDDNFEITLTQTIVLDSADFRDFTETYSFDLPLAYTDSVEKVSCRGYADHVVISAHLTRCYVTLKGTEQGMGSYYFDFLDQIDMFVEGMVAEESYGHDIIASNKKLQFGNGGKTTYKETLEDNIASFAITFTRDPSNSVMLPYTATVEVLLNFDVWVQGDCKI